jgi:hypothetical protein
VQDVPDTSHYIADCYAEYFVSSLLPPLLQNSSSGVLRSVQSGLVSAPPSVLFSFYWRKLTKWRPCTYGRHVVVSQGKVAGRSEWYLPAISLLTKICSILPTSPRATLTTVDPTFVDGSGFPPSFLSFECLPSTLLFHIAITLSQTTWFESRCLNERIHSRCQVQMAA